MAPLMAAGLPSLWDSGVRWGTAGVPAGTQAYWQGSSSPTLTAGKPELIVSIGTNPYSPMSGKWSLGRDGWFEVLGPTSASFGFAVGLLSAVGAGDRIVVMVAVPAGDGWTESLWSGYVDTVTQSDDPATGDSWTTVTATDIVGKLGQADAPTSVAAGNLATIAQAVALDAGLTITVDQPWSAFVALPSLLADATVEATVLEYINRAERSSNGVVFLRGNGRLAAVPRKPVVSGTFLPALALTGANSPGEWVTQQSGADIINRWSFTDEAGSWSFSKDAVGGLIQAFGASDYSVDDMLTASEAPYTDIMAFDYVLGRPRTVVSEATFPIRSRAQTVLWLDPLDYVAYSGHNWTVMSVKHEASPGGDWTVTITADMTVNALCGTAD